MAQHTFTLTINDELTITSGTPPDGVKNQAYSHQFTATGGMGTRQWSVVAGTLPTGITLNGSSGLMSGTPTQSGTFSNITIQVVNV